MARRLLLSPDEVPAYVHADLDGSANGKGGLSLKTLGELWAEPESAVEWLVAGLLPANGVSLMVSPPKVGKSTLARCLAVATATGGEWLGKPVQSGPVIHLALEERPQTVSRHYRQLAAPSETIHLLTGPAPRPGDRMTRLRQSIDELAPALVIVDPLFRFLKVDDGNDYAESLARLDPVLTIARETNTHLLLIHHARKGGGERGDEILGSTGLSASVDTTVSLKQTDGRRLFYAFGRDGVEIEKTLLTMDTRTGWVDVAETKREADRRDIEGLVFECVQDASEPLTKPEIVQKTGKRAASVVAALRRLIEARDLATTGTGKRGDPMRYSVSIPCSP